MMWVMHISEEKAKLLLLAIWQLILQLTNETLWVVSCINTQVAKPPRQRQDGPLLCCIHALQATKDSVPSRNPDLGKHGQWTRTRRQKDPSGPEQLARAVEPAFLFVIVSIYLLLHPSFPRLDETQLSPTHSQTWSGDRWRSPTTSAAVHPEAWAATKTLEKKITKIDPNGMFGINRHANSTQNGTLSRQHQHANRGIQFLCYNEYIITPTAKAIWGRSKKLTSNRIEIPNLEEILYKLVFFLLLSFIY